MAVSRAKLVIGATVIAGAAAYLAIAAVQSGWVYYVPVDQFMAEQGVPGRRIRLCGMADAIEADPGRFAFELRGETARIRVQYRGVSLPQLLKPGAQVVVEGSLDQSGVFVADVLLTKCASKYEAKTTREPRP